VKKFFVFCLVLLSLSFCFVGCGDDKYFEVTSKEITDTYLKYEIQVSIPIQVAYATPQIRAFQSPTDYNLKRIETETDKDTTNYIFSVKYDLTTSSYPPDIELSVLYITLKDALEQNFSSDDCQAIALASLEIQGTVHNEPAENYLKYLKTLTYTLSLSEGK
jgi:hypothetical protein